MTDELELTDRERIVETIIGVVAKQLEIVGEKIDPDKEITDELGADSLDVIEILVSLESIFGIDVPDEEIVNIKTVNDATEYIIGRNTGKPIE